MTTTRNPVVWRCLAVRVGVLGLVLAALVAGAYAGVMRAAGMGFLAVLAYALGRGRARGDFHYSTAQAIVVPDWLGFVLAGVFLAIPVWASADGWAAGRVHPSAWLLWPMALVGGALLWVGWRSECFALSLSGQEMDLARGWHQHRLRLEEIATVRPWRRDLPGWMRALVPFLVLAGRPGPAGAILLARERQGIALVLRDGSELVIETDGLVPPESALVSALAAAGVDMPALADRRNFKQEGS